MEDKEINIQVKNTKRKNTNPRKKRAIGLTFGFIGTALAAAGIATGVCYAIYSKMHRTYTITFDRGEGYFTSGNGIVHIDRVLPFGQIAKPEIWNTDESKVFAGWYVNDTDEYPVLDTQNISSNLTLKPKFVNKNDDNYAIVTFDRGEIEGATLTGNTTVAIRKADNKNYFGLVNKPYPYALNYNFIHWSSNGSDPSDPESIMFTDTTIKSNITLYPFYQYDIEEVLINGPEELHIQDEWQYTSKILGCQSPIKWSVTDASGNPTSLAEINENTGLVKAKSTGTIKVWATPTLVPKKAVSKTVTIDNPYVNSNEFYCYGKAGSETCWWTISIDTLYSGDIKLTKFGNVNGVETVARDQFDLPVYIGDKVAGIKDNFLKGCTNFKSDIIFQSNSDIASIGDNFLYGCTSFNNEINLPSSLLNIGSSFLEGCTKYNNNSKKLTIASSITRINSNFLYGCSAFDSELEIPNNVLHIESNFLYGCIAFNSKLTLSNNLVSINDHFLGSCSAFNKELILPESLQNIGDSFMYGCINFNQNLTIPAEIKQIGVSFMYECKMLNGKTITINTELEPSKIFGRYSGDNETLAVHDDPGSSYKINITGTKAEDLQKIFPYRSATPFRNLVVVTEP